jgi:hypothetical protein
MKKMSSLRPIVRDSPHEILKTKHGGVSSFVPAASVRIVDKYSLPHGLEKGDDQMVDDPVTKIRSEDFAMFGFAGNERRRRGWLISPVLQVFAQLEQVLFQPLLELQSAPGVPLASAAAEISPVHVFKRKQGNHHSPERRTHKARLLLELSMVLTFRLPLLKLKFHAEPEP